MAVFANVNGKIKELYRVFFNDNGVIREIESLHAQNDNNEIKELFVRDPSVPKVLDWVTYIDGVSIINNIWNNGYAMNGIFTEHRRSASTSNKIYLSAGTKIKVSISNIEHETSSRPPYEHINIYLFKDESTTPYQSYEGKTSNIMTVNTSGYYYVAFAVFWTDYDDNIYRATMDVKITITPSR